MNVSRCSTLASTSGNRISNCDSETEKLEQQLLAKADATALEWYQLARYRESQRQLDDAATAIDKAIEMDPKSVLAFTAAARIAESAGDFGERQICSAS